MTTIDCDGSSLTAPPSRLSAGVTELTAGSLAAACLLACSSLSLLLGDVDEVPVWSEGEELAGLGDDDDEPS